MAYIERDYTCMTPVVNSHKPNKQQKEIDLIGNVVAVLGQHDCWRHNYQNVDLVKDLHG